MKKIGFIGAANKTNLIMYVAKVLNLMDKKVLVVDTSIEQEMKYIVPTISPTKEYVTEFEHMDFAVGFKSVEDIKKYLAIKEEKMPYDYMLIDIDSEEMIEEFDIEDADKNYFVTTFDMYALRRGVEILQNIKQPLKLTKVLYSHEIIKEDEEYLNYLAMGYKIVWNNTTIYLPKAELDNQAIEENQRIFTIRIKKLSVNYQEGIEYIAQDILGERNINKIRKSIKE